MKQARTEPRRWTFGEGEEDGLLPAPPGARKAERYVRALSILTPPRGLSAVLHHESSQRDGGRVNDARMTSLPCWCGEGCERARCGPDPSFSEEER